MRFSKNENLIFMWEMRGKSQSKSDSKFMSIEIPQRGKHRWSIGDA